MMERYGGTGQFITSCVTGAAGLVLANKGVYMLAGAASIPASFGLGVTITAVAAGFAAASVGFAYGPKIYNKLRYGMPKLGRSSSHPTSRQAMSQKKGPSFWKKITNAFNMRAEKTQQKQKDVEFTPRNRQNRENTKIKTGKEHKL